MSVTIRLRHLLLAAFVLAAIQAASIPLAVSLAQQSPSSQQSEPRAPIGSAFGYQGRLDVDGVPADGTYDFLFTLHDAADAGTTIAGPLLREGVSVTSGIFTVALDFGSSALNGQSRFLAVEARASGEATFASLGARQELTPAPYALFATDGNFWKLNGNSGTTPGTNFLGTTDNTAFELKVNGQRALRIEPGSSPNIVAGAPSNSAAGVIGAVIAGGGGSLNNTRNRIFSNFGVIGGGDLNTIDGPFGSVAGGTLNTAFEAGAVSGGTGNVAADYAAVGGGYSNNAAGDYSTIAGGQGNITSPEITHEAIGGGYLNSAAGFYSTVAGGKENGAAGISSAVGGGESNKALNHFVTIAGGDHNSASGQTSSVGGGASNLASGQTATVSGGASNLASGQTSTVAGGENNTASGLSATVPGGKLNLAGGAYSFAAGQRAKAQGTGSFVWADSRAFDFGGTGVNEFQVRATGGVYLTWGIDANTGAATKTCLLHPAGMSWSCPSDRNMKTNFRDVDTRDILDKLDALPVLYWQAKDVEAPSDHLGPMAQDFAAAFGLGESDTAISTIDLDGVSLAAIKGLYQLVKEHDARLAAIGDTTGVASPPPAHFASATGPIVDRESSLALAASLFAGLALIALRRRSTAVPASRHFREPAAPVA